MKRFNINKSKPAIMCVLPSVIIIAALLFLIIGSDNLSSAGSDQEYTIVRNALDRSITQCYALEGAYPPDLDYLHDNYGFTYNTAHFYIDYQYIGGNLRPDVTIISKDSEN